MSDKTPRTFEFRDRSIPRLAIPPKPKQHDYFDTKMRAIRCYASQFDHATTAGEIFPTGQPLYDLIETQSRHYGSLIRAPYGEPYFTWETVEVDDIMRLGVQSM